MTKLRDVLKGRPELFERHESGLSFSMSWLLHETKGPVLRTGL